MSNTRKLTPAERRLRRISQLVAGLPEGVMRGLCAEFLLNNGEIFEELNRDLQVFSEKFSSSWKNFQDYGKEGNFE